MNAVRNIVLSSLRGYRTFRGGRRSSAWDSRREEATTEPETLPESLEPDDGEYDIDAYESDFSTAGEADRMHRAELALRKERAKNRIAKRKYFRSEEPAMLTWGEKEQIRHLHAEDPTEWSTERLSSSFPASLEAVEKIVRSDWAPRSTKVVDRYEARVKENWELFRAGRLAVDARLGAHLANFKNRKIATTYAESARKFLKPKPIFSRPKSTMFSGVIEAYEKARRSRAAETEGGDARSSGDRERIASGGDVGRSSLVELSGNSMSRDSMTYDMFLEKHAEGVDESRVTPVDRVIVDEYKRTKAESYKSDTLVMIGRSAMGRTDRRVAEVGKEREASVANVSSVTSKPEFPVIEESGMETGIVTRERKVEASEDYPYFIKIPRKRYKQGATYRVEDRYYDDDGEFLYRIPGLLS